MNSELIYAKQRMQDYFYAVYTLGTHYPPPGTNAAHGWFQQGMKELRKLGDYKDGSFEEGGDAQNCSWFSEILFTRIVMHSVPICIAEVLSTVSK